MMNKTDIKQLEQKLALGDEELNWWEDHDWWASKGQRGVVTKEASEQRKFQAAQEAFMKGMAKILGAGGSTGSGNGGGIGASGVPMTSGNVNSGAGMVPTTPQATIGGSGAVTKSPYGFGISLNAQQAQAPTNFSQQAKDEIVEVKQKLVNLLKLHHVPKNSVIAGGVFVSLFHGTEPEDIDVFILGAHDDDQIDLPDMLKPGKYTTMKSFQNYTGRDDIISIFNDKESKFQYIYTSVPDARTLLDDFDFVHACCAYYDEKLWINPKIYDAIKNKWLIPNGDPAKIKEVRKNKFIARGFVEPGDLTNLYEAKP